MLKRQWELRKGELMLIAIIVASMTLGMSALVNIIVAIVDDGEEFVQMAPAAGIVGVGISLIFCAGFTFAGRFNLAISCGETRKSFVWGEFLFTLLEGTIAMGMVLLISPIEKIILQAVAGNRIIIDTGKYIFHAEYIIWGVLFIIALIMLCNALTMRYGKIAFWIMWAVWMICSLGSSKIIPFIMHTEWIKDFLQKVLPATGTLVVGYLLVPVMLGIAWGYLRKQRVTL